jgi:hypothetical protein
MNTTILTRVRSNFNCGDARIDRHNRRAWVRSVRMLGDKWLLAKPIRVAGR